jgi:hypothetical protein
MINGVDPELVAFSFRNDGRNEKKGRNEKEGRKEGRKERMEGKKKERK